MRLGRVGVLAGGPSNERDISLRSGQAVYNALIKNGIDAIFLDVYENVCDIIKKNRVDIAFIALHGRFGEDGTIQKILEDCGIPYTGSGPQASALALDKIASKHVFVNNRIPVPKYIVFEKWNFSIDDAGALGFPLVVKPQMEGSSIGLSVVREKKDLADALNEAFRYGEKIILEEYIDGRELTVGILDDEPLPVIEIVTKERVYDYKAKYTAPDTKYLVPAPIDDKLSEKAKRLGKLAHTSLGCRSFSRADMMMDGSGNIFVLEINTIPGMTERSLLPKAAEACGLSFDRLCVKLIENAKTAKGITK
ncbi:MAG: D-alanine--D-alanine ligase [Candidatus Omnitrophica bacterium]|nr:D-alanine--D-alanine ligase [Candidatus Omnitrophota bacterium]